MIIDILRYEVLTRTVELFGEIPNFIGKEFFPDEVIASDTAKWDKITHGRTLGVYRAPHGPTKRIDLLGREQKTASLASIGLNKKLSSDVLLWIREIGSSNNRQRVEDKIGMELRDLRRRVAYQREWAFFEAMKGTITVNQEDIKFTVDMGMTDTHKPTVNASWATVATDIVADITTLKRLIATDSGFSANLGLMSDMTMGYLLKNNTLKELMRYERGLQIAQEGYINRVNGVNFRVYDQGYDLNGTYTRFIPDGHVFMLAPESGFGSEMIGESLVPSDVDGELPRKVSGEFAYSYQEKDPVTVNICYGLNHLPVVKMPEAIAYVDVVP